MVRSCTSVGRAAGPSSSARVPPACRRRVSIWNSRSWACTQPWRRNRSWRLPARMWAIPLASRSTWPGPSSPGTSTGSAAALEASTPAGSSRARARTTTMARRMGVLSWDRLPAPGATAALGIVRTRRSLPNRGVRSSAVGPTKRGVGVTGARYDEAMTRWTPSRVPAMVAAAVVAVALVVVGVVALGGNGGGTRGAGTAAKGSGDGNGGTRADLVRLTVTPRDKATKVALGTRAKVVADSGRLRAVKVTASGGRRLAGKLASDGRSWVSTGPLAPATRYQVVAEAVDEAGTPTRRQTTFTTLRPRAELRAAIMPLDGETVGVGLPIGVWFNQPVADRAAVERRLEVTSSKPVTGAWHWFADNEVHYRPRDYWPSGSRVTLRTRLAGTDAGDGVWGVADRTIRFRIGERRVSVVDVRTHRMKVVSGGRTLRVLPVSTGRERYPTTNGIHFVVEKTKDKLMDSSTVGIPRNSPGGYYQHVAWSVRISNSGEFVHAAPWSTGSQGRANVSHGCVNLSTANAAWYFRLTRRGDVVEVRGSPKRPGTSFGVADWNMSWSRWLAGSAR